MEEFPQKPEHADYEIGDCVDRNKTKRRRMEVALSDFKDAHCYFYDFIGENSALLCVFDGHAGKGAAEWCAENVPKMECQHLTVPEVFQSTFSEADSKLVRSNGITSGCTAGCAFFRNESRNGNIQRVLYTANVGDTRIVLVRKGDPICLTYEHKASDPREVERIISAGGFVSQDRVSGMLAVSRALGDDGMKEHVIGSPFTSEIVLTQDDEWIIVACDGLWDVCSNEKSVEIIRNLQSALEASEFLVDYALENGSTDNLTVIVVKLK